MVALVVLFLGSKLPALSAAAQAEPGAAASPCFGAAAGGHGPEPPYEQQSLLPSDPSIAAPAVGTKSKVCLCVSRSDLTFMPNLDAIYFFNKLQFHRKYLKWKA